MKWMYSIEKKTRLALLLATIMGLVLLKNLLDSSNVNQLASSFETVYADRLLVESYIFQLSGHLYAKKTIVDNCSRQPADVGLLQKLDGHNQSIAALLQAYEKTQLTQAEERYFTFLQKNVQGINALEAHYLASQSQTPETVQTHRQIDNYYEQAAQNLDQLSFIQVAEGKRLNEKSKQIIAGSTLLTQFELVLIILIGVLVQMLIFASKSAMPRFPQKPQLN